MVLSNTVVNPIKNVFTADQNNSQQRRYIGYKRYVYINLILLYSIFPIH